MGTITNGIFISNQSLDIITKTGNYRGANISELIPYTTPSSWCGIKAYVQSDNAAFFNIITNNNIVINAYRDGDGTYKIYPLALKSDLSSSQNYPYIVTCTNAIDQSLFLNAQFRARRTENGTGAAAFGFENVGVNSGALYLDPSDYKLHFINYEGKQFVINWTAEN